MRLICRLLCCYVAGGYDFFGSLFEIPTLYYFFGILFPRDGNIFKAQTNQNLSHLIG